jgi:hypothetical protein
VAREVHHAALFLSRAGPSMSLNRHGKTPFAK